MSRALHLLCAGLTAALLAACASKPVELKPQPARVPAKLKGVGTLAVDPAASAAQPAKK